MRITVIGPAYPLRGGIANFTESLAIALQNKGHQVLVVSFSLQYPNVLFPGKTQFVENTTAPDLLIHNWINSVNPLSWLSAAGKIKKQQPDLVIISYWMPFFAPAFGVITRRLKASLKLPVIALAHNIKPHEKRFGDHALSAYFIKKCDGFVTLAKSVLDDVDEFVYTENKLFVPHPIYDIFGQAVSKKQAREKLGLDTEARYVLFFGLVRKYKGLDLLLEAMNDERLKNIHLIIAGEFYDNQDDYKELITKLKDENRLILKNEFIPSDEVKFYFSAANLVAQPYRTATQSGVSQIAYNFEVPMLVTNVGGLSEIVPHNKVGYVVQPNRRDIAQAIDNYFSQNREPEMCENMKEEKKRFSWENMANKILELYDKIQIS